jgi:hypothetical protein
MSGHTPTHPPNSRVLMSENFYKNRIFPNQNEHVIIPVRRQGRLYFAAIT